MASNQSDKRDLNQIVEFAKSYAKIFEQLSEAILSFIPNGLEQIYNKGLKKLPVFSPVFQHRWVEQVVKLCTGITIGQGLSSDVARFVFWPIGWVIGFFIGMLTQNKPPMVLASSINKFLYKLSGATVPCTLLGALSGMLIHHFFFLEHPQMKLLLVVGIGSLLGAFIGITIYGLYLLALTWVKSQQTQHYYQQVGVAKKLGIKLKESARQMAKGRILVYAQDIIQQMNGSAAQSDLADFFESELDIISQMTNKKIDRHICYLTEKATHGDEQALYRLQVLVNKKTDLNKLLDRVFNARAIAKIKDEVDTRYDRWHYRFLKA